MSKHTIPTELNIAPRGKSWLHGQLIDGDHGHPTRQSMESAERAQAIQCTCPSGDGSLHWPCPAHPPAAVPGGWQELAARVMDALADAQDRTNAKYPEHVKCYPTWETRPRHLRWLAEMFRTGKPIGNGAGQPDVLAALAATPAAPESREELAHRLIGEVKAADAIATAICQRVAELGDRSSPEDWPEAMLVTGDELHLIAREAVIGAQETPAAAAPVVLPEWEKVRRGLTMVMLGLAGRPDCSESAIEAALDAATEPGMPLAALRMLSGVQGKQEAHDDAMDWDQLPEDPSERAMFDRNLELLYGGDPRIPIATSLRIWANTRGNGSFGLMCAILANEVAKLHIAPQAQADARDAERRDLDAQELQGIALQAAWRGGLKQNAPAYLPRSPMSAAVFKAHDWVIEAMRDAIKAAQAAQQGGDKQ